MSEVHPDHIRAQIQKLELDLDADGLPFEEHEKIEARIAGLKARLKHHSNQQKGRDRRANEERQIARHEAWKAAFAEVTSDQNELLSLVAETSKTFLAAKPSLDATLSKYPEFRS